MAPLAPIMRHVQAGGRQHVEDAGKKAAEQIKPQKSSGSQVILQGFPKDPEEPQVADEVDPPGMEEEGAEHGGQQPHGLAEAQDLEPAQLGGHRPLLIKKVRGRIGSDVELIEKDRQIDGDQTQGDPGPPVFGRRPADGNHEAAPGFNPLGLDLMRTTRPG